MEVLNSFILVSAMVISFLLFTAGAVAFKLTIKNVKLSAVGGMLWWLSVFFIRWTILVDRSNGDSLLNSPGSRWLTDWLATAEAKALLFGVAFALVIWVILTGMKINQRIENGF